jgi:hypothetical protein
VHVQYKLFIIMFFFFSQAYNLVGLVRQNNEDDLSTIDVEFHNASHHHSIHLSNHLSHTMASLSETALLLACHSTEDVCRLASIGNLENK